MKTPAGHPIAVVVVVVIHRGGAPVVAVWGLQAFHHVHVAAVVEGEMAQVVLDVMATAFSWIGNTGSMWKNPAFNDWEQTNIMDSTSI